MPSKNVIKTYVKNGVYHIYNRGVEKRTIFKDSQDYEVFLDYLKEALSRPSSNIKKSRIVNVQGSTFNVEPRKSKNFYGEIDLLAYCLMPNHFHLLIKQNNKESIKNFMKSVCTRYSMYFNKRYNRVGPLFQGIYKAAYVAGESYLLHLSRYIHKNSLELNVKLTDAYSSYKDYLLGKKTSWLNPLFILSFFTNGVGQEFKKFNNYKNFVGENDSDDEKLLSDLKLD